MIRAAAVLVVCAAPTLAQDAVPTLNQIMADPSWYARPPQTVGWLPDSSGVLWDQRRAGVVGRDTTDRTLQTLSGVRPANSPRPLDDAARATTLTAGDVWTPDRSRMLATHAGDVFLYDAAKATWGQLTRTTAGEWSPMFLTHPDQIAFRRGSGWVVRDLATGLESDAADVRFAEDPAKAEDPKRDDLAQSQHDLFTFLREREERDHLNEGVDRAREQADPARVPGPFYLDDSKRPAGQWLSPSGDFLLVAASPKNSPSDKADQMPAYVTEDGYVSTRRVRPNVGQEHDAPISFYLLDLRHETVTELPLDSLPTISDDPLADIKADVKARRAAEERAKRGDDAQEPAPESKEGDETPAATSDGVGGDDAADPGEGGGEGEPRKPGKPRPVSEMGVRWSDSGRTAAVMLRSHDNKDRWIAVVDTAGEKPALACVHHQRDPAWINWEFNDFGFLPRSESVWFLSEHTGYGHLYLSAGPDAEPRALTAGAFEVRSPRPFSDGSGFLVRTNRKDPGVYELERVALDASYTPLTNMGGTVESYDVAPDETRAVVTFSTAMDPPELYAVSITRPGPPVRLTETTTEAFRSFRFTAPGLVDVPSTHAARPIRTRVYRPDPVRFPGKRPIVIFSHGAGYLQFANNGWAYYAREHMFHTLLTERGIIVLGPDFRASEGYGRDWRTAIYRNMGYPELEDFDDCIAYAARELDGDPERVGIYGGSYGGFMTLMAMFLRPDVYDCGAALRSVTDWRHYNHGYTANILDTPAIDPEPFDRCSPITHAEGLKGRLLMCHGMLDDNVVAQDIIRLSQRLIELEKEDWELALFPIESHGFEEPSAWLDEYRRILKLFEQTLLRDDDVPPGGWKRG